MDDKRLGEIVEREWNEQWFSLPRGLYKSQMSRDSAYLASVIVARAVRDEMSAWVPVGERLPERGVDVLTFDSTGLCDVDRIGDDGEWEFIIAPHRITHWRPIPAPPQPSGDTGELP